MKETEQQNSLLNEITEAVESLSNIPQSEFDGLIQEKKTRKPRATSKTKSKEEALDKAVKGVQKFVTSMLIQSADGQEIKVRDIMAKVLKKAGDEKVTAIYVKTDDNRAYFVTENREDNVELW